MALILVLYSLIIALAGNSLLFPAYMSDIKNRLNFNQGNLLKFSIFKDLGSEGFELIAGLIVEALPTQIAISLGITLRFIGFLIIWLTKKYWLLSIGLLLSSASESLICISCRLAALKNHLRKNLVLLLLQASICLGSGYLLLIHESIKRFSLISILVVFPTVVMVLIYCFIWKEQRVQIESRKVWLYWLLAGLCIFSLVLSLKPLTNISAKVAAIAASVVWISPAIAAFFVMKKKKKSDNVTETESESESESDGGQQQPPQQPIRRRYFQDNLNRELFQTMKTRECLEIIIPTSVSLSLTATSIDLIYQLVEALLLSPKTGFRLVTTVSISVFLGRIITAFFTEFLLKHNYTRTILTAPLSFLSSLSFLLLAFPILGFSSFVSYLVLGFSHGGQLQLASMILTDRFGQINQLLFSIIKILVPILTYIFKIYFVSYFFEKAAITNRPVFETQLSNTDKTCIGKSCFKISFIIFAIIMFLMSIIWALVYFEERTKDRSHSSLTTRESS